MGSGAATQPGDANKQQAIAEELRQRERLEKSYRQVIEDETRDHQRKTIQRVTDEFLVDYPLKHESATFAEYAFRHVCAHLGKRLIVEVTPAVVKRYQTGRLPEEAGPKTINDEVMLLPRLCGDQGDLIRAKLRREKALKLKTPPPPRAGVHCRREGPDARSGSEAPQQEHVSSPYT
jgi:hypothetical protein